MSLLNWNNNYSVGIEAMDSQHQKLLAIMNQFNDAMLAGKSKDILGKVFQELIEYTAYHFTAEEELMKSANYQELSAHIQLHQELIKKVKDYHTRFAQGEMIISTEVMTFLKDWLINHIVRTDKKYGQFIHSSK